MEQQVPRLGEKHVTRKLLNLPPECTAAIKTGLALGFGKTTIVAIATCEEGATYTKNGTASLLFVFFVGVLKSDYFLIMEK